DVLWTQLGVPGPVAVDVGRDALAVAVRHLHRRRRLAGALEHRAFALARVAVLRSRDRDVLARQRDGEADVAGNLRAHVVHDLLSTRGVLALGKFVLELQREGALLIGRGAPGRLTVDIDRHLGLRSGL